MSTIIDPLRMRYFKCSLPNILESRIISKNFTEVTFDTGDPKILRDGRTGVVLPLVKTIH